MIWYRTVCNLPKKSILFKESTQHSINLCPGWYLTISATGPIRLGELCTISIRVSCYNSLIKELDDKPQVCMSSRMWSFLAQFARGNIWCILLSCLLSGELLMAICHDEWQIFSTTSSAMWRDGSPLGRETLFSFFR